MVATGGPGLIPGATPPSGAERGGAVAVARDIGFGPGSRTLRRAIGPSLGCAIGNGADGNGTGGDGRTATAAAGAGLGAAACSRAGCAGALSAFHVSVGNAERTTGRTVGNWCDCCAPGRPSGASTEALGPTVDVVARVFGSLAGIASLAAGGTILFRGRAAEGLATFCVPVGCRASGARAAGVGVRPCASSGFPVNIPRYFCSANDKPSRICMSDTLTGTPCFPVVSSRGRFVARASSDSVFPMSTFFFSSSALKSNEKNPTRRLHTCAPRDDGCGVRGISE